jgi:hypothetical protein
MRLLPFAFTELDGQTNDWQQFVLEYVGVTVSVRNSKQRGDRLVLLVAADVPLGDDFSPAVDRAGMAVVPDEERRAAEAAIETAANLVSIATGHRRSITSPNLAVAFRVEAERDRKLLHSRVGLPGIERGA